MPETLDQLVQRIRDTHPVTLDCRIFSGAVALHLIAVPADQRRIGVGSAVMGELCAFADQHQLTITLTAFDGFGTQVETLIDFYARFGFEAHLPNRPTSLRRIPRPTDTASRATRPASAGTVGP